MKIQIPILEEQQVIGHYLNVVDAKIEMIRLQTIRSQQFKNGLLQQMFI